jgi:hypothetical protein
MAVIDQKLTYKDIEAKLAATTNPRHRRMLEQLLQHARGEVEEDLEAVLGTLGPNPVYKSSIEAPGMNPTGMEDVVRFYKEQIFGKGRHCLESTKPRILVSDDAIVTEGTVRSVHWGQDLIDTGTPDVEADGFYLLTYQMLIVWPYDEECRITGEESWSRRTGGDYMRKIREDELPESFARYVARRRAERAAA